MGLCFLLARSSSPPAPLARREQIGGPVAAQNPTIMRRHASRNGLSRGVNSGHAEGILESPVDLFTLFPPSELRASAPEFQFYDDFVSD